MPEKRSVIACLLICEICVICGLFICVYLWLKPFTQDPLDETRLRRLHLPPPPPRRRPPARLHAPLHRRRHRPVRIPLPPLAQPRILPRPRTRGRPPPPKTL